MPEIEEADLKILEVLIEDSRLNANQISSRTGVRKSEIKGRIAKMERNGAILGYGIKLGIATAKLGMVGSPRGSPEPAMIISRSDLVGLTNEVNRVFGSGSGIILYHAGFGIGANMANQMKTHTQDRTKSFKEFNRVMKTRGWGNVSIEMAEHSDKSGRVTFADMPFHKNDASHEFLEMLLRGICTGFMSNILNTEKVSLHKEKCVARGGDVCMFSFEIQGVT